MKKLILFIHGFMGGAATWGDFEKLLESDNQISEQYTIGFLEYPTGVLKDPKIQRLSESLRTILNHEYEAYDDIVLVCHSMGGLVVKKYLVEEIKARSKSPLRVKKVLFYDTPHNGADIANYGKILPHNQLKQMARNSEFIEFLNTDAYTLDIAQYVCMKYILAEESYKGIKVVSIQSEQGIWANRDTETLIDRDHLSCCKPIDHEDMVYRILQKFVLNPCYKKDLFPQPKLSTKLLRRETENNRFHYKSSFIPFVGREKEIVALDNFCDDDAPFLWWVMYEEGGTGKSRLALEYSQILQSRGTHAGFYTLSSGFEWGGWQTQSDTFIVIDYAGSHVSALKEMLLLLNDAEESMMHKVRVLLLERTLDAPSEWYHKGLLGGYGSLLDDTLYTTAHPIGELSSDDLIEIASRFNPTLPKEDFLSQLASIDPKKRPLFASILAEDFSLETTLDRTVLLKRFLSRTKEKYWSEIEQCTLLLAGILSIIDEGDIDTIASEILSDCCVFEKNTEQLASLLGHPIDDAWRYAGIAPDMIGELFVLELLGNHSQDRVFTQIVSPQTREKILTVLWDKYPREIAIFLSRCGKDFWEHKGLDEIGDNLYLSSEISVEWWVEYRVNFITTMREHNLDKALKLFEDLEKFAKSYVGNEKIALDVARGSFNLIRTMRNHNLNKALNLFENLKNIAKKYTKNTKIALMVTRGINNLITTLSKDNLDKAFILLEDLKNLAKEHHANEEIALRVAKESFKLINTMMEYDLDKALNLFEDLKIFAKRYEGNEEIALKVAWANYNLITTMREHDLGKAVNLFEALKSFAKKYEHNEKIALKVAWGNYNLLTTMREYNLDKALNLFEELKHFSKRHEGNEEIALEVAWASYNLIDTLVEDDLDKALNIFEGLKKLAKKYEENEKIALTVAWGSRSLIYLMKEHDLDKALNIFDALKVFAKKYEKNEKIALEVARGSCNLLNTMSEDDLESALILFEELELFAKRYEKNEEIVSMVEQGRNNIRVKETVKNTFFAGFKRFVFNR